MYKLKALIFDFNGTLFWDSDINYRAWNKSVKTWFNREYTEEEYRRYNGRTGAETVAELFGKELTKNQTEEYLKYQTNNYFDICRKTPHLNMAPGIEDFLKFARAMGLVCSVATSAPDSSMDIYYPLLKLDRLFSRETVICNNGNYRSKPYPDIFIGAVEKLGLKPEECMAFEDTDSGLTSAYNAGIRNVVAVTGDNTTKLITEVPYIAEIRDFKDSVLKSLIYRLK